MGFLLLASLLWSFSFGLIGHFLAGVPPCLVAFIRLFISVAVFLPFLKRTYEGKRFIFDIMATGALQYGLMYLFYQSSYLLIPSHLVALSTIVTPVYVSVIYDLHRRKLHGVFLLASIIAVGGAAVIKASGVIPSRSIAGFLLVQVSNVFFAFGQVHYKIIMETRKHLKDSDVYALMYIGAVIAAFIPAMMDGPSALLELNTKQTGVLLYLGVVPSGLAFFLWNAGARRVNAGVLAVFNNMKIPLAIMVSIIIFKEKADVFYLTGGTAILILALLVSGWRTYGRHL